MCLYHEFVMNTIYVFCYSVKTHPALFVGDVKLRNAIKSVHWLWAFLFCTEVNNELNGKLAEVVSYAESFDITVTSQLYCTNL